MAHFFVFFPCRLPLFLYAWLHYKNVHEQLLPEVSEPTLKLSHLYHACPLPAHFSINKCSICVVGQLICWATYRTAPGNLAIN